MLHWQAKFLRIYRQSNYNLVFICLSFQYIEPTRGLIIELETGHIFGEHSGVHHFTLGQKIPGVTWGNEAFYVAKLDSGSQEVFIVSSFSFPFASIGSR